MKSKLNTKMTPTFLEIILVIYIINQEDSIATK